MGAWLSWWSERAGRAEGDLDRLCEAVEALRWKGKLSHLTGPEWWELDEALAVAREGRKARYRPLPAGPTLTGSLTSGGIET